MASGGEQQFSGRVHDQSSLVGNYFDTPRSTSVMDATALSNIELSCQNLILKVEAIIKNNKGETLMQIPIDGFSDIFVKYGEDIKKV